MTSDSGQQNSAEPLPPTRDRLTEGAASAPVQPQKRLASGWLRDVIISLAVSAFFIIFLYQPVRVEGTSMMPTLQDQERVFINKFVYKLEPIERSDVIVFRYPRDPAKSYIKRVIAVAGDRVKIDDGVVYVNGHRLHETYVPEVYEDVRSYPETVVPPHCYFVLGDHRNLSNDSRDFGPVDEELHLREGCLRLLAGCQAGHAAVVEIPIFAFRFSPLAFAPIRVQVQASLAIDWRVLDLLPREQEARSLSAKSEKRKVKALRHFGCQCKESS
jgi:signal peptidase I